LSGNDNFHNDAHYDIVSNVTFLWKMLKYCL